MAEVVNLGYEARDAFIPYHQRDQRWAVVVARRRAGKTVACILDLIDAAIRCPRKAPRFAYIAPQLKQAKDAAWTYVQEYGLKIPGATVHQNELRLDLPGGARVRLYGSDNPDAMRGIYLDGVVLDEYADMHPQLYPNVVRPALSDRKGWATWIGTPKGPNDFYELWQKAKGDPDFFTLMLRASQDPTADPAELEDARNHMTPEQYAREYECSFAAPNVGTYYGKAMELALKEERIVPKLFSTTHEVHTAWDLGGMTSIWFFQKVGAQIWIVDYYANTSFDLGHYAKVLQDRDYKYGQHYLPHDVEHKVQGSSGSLMHSRKTTLINLGIPVSVVPKHEIEDGRNAVVKLLPRCVFDQDKCKEGIKAMQLYHRCWDDQRKIFLERHYEDWTAHPADAFRYLAMSCFDQPASNKPSWLKKQKDRLGWIV